MDSGRTSQPYPVTAVIELEADYSAKHLRYAVEQCRDVISKVVAEDNSTNQQASRVRLLRYLDLQLSRVDKWAEDDTDLMAYALRNIMELVAWSNFISESEENAITFLKETDIDSKELLTRLVKFNPDEKIPIYRIVTDVLRADI